MASELSYSMEQQVWKMCQGLNAVSVNLSRVAHVEQQGHSATKEKHVGNISMSNTKIPCQL